VGILTPAPQFDGGQCPKAPCQLEVKHKSKKLDSNHPPEEAITSSTVSFRSIAFNRRVLAQAADDRVPLLERLKFLCIVSSNLDEFFEVRIGGLREQVKLGARGVTSDGRSAQEALRLIASEAHQLIAEQYSLLNDVILPALETEGIVFLRRGAWTDEQRSWIRDYFTRELMPVLTPIGLDPSHPFPRVLNKSLNFAVELEGRDAFGRSSRYAIVQAPRALPRVIKLPKELTGVDNGFVFLSSAMHMNVGDLFEGMNVLGCYQFRVTRNSDLFLDEEEVKNLRHLRCRANCRSATTATRCRLEVADNCSEHMADFLLQQFNLTRDDLYRAPGIVNLVRLMQVPDWVDRPDLKYPPFAPTLPRAMEKRYDIFAMLRRQDILLHHPFESFSPVIDLVQQAVDDPDVVAIKMTVYRTGTDSVLMEALGARRTQGQGSDRRRRTDGTLRRRGQPQHRQSPGRSRRPCGLRRVRLQDPCQDADGAAPRGQGLPPLHPPRHRQLPPAHHPPSTPTSACSPANPEIGEDVNEVFKQLTGMGKDTAR
jgi:polyphosphate kinase